MKTSLAILALVIIAAIAATSRAQPLSHDDLYAAPVIEPAHHLSFGRDGVESIAFAPDGKKIYVLVQDRAVYMWYLLLYWRRAVLGVALGLITIPLALRARRVVRRPQVRGRVYCRGCNYDLAAQVEAVNPGTTWPVRVKADGRCPECGVELARRHPARGRATRGGLAAVVVVWALLAGGYVYAWKWPFNSSGRPAWIDSWTSISLARLGERHRILWLMEFTMSINRVQVVDLGTGRTLRTILRTQCANLALSPDGEALILAERGLDRIAVYRAATGRKIRSSMLPGRCNGCSIEPLVAGWSADGQTAYVPWCNEAGNKDGVSAWNLKSGKLKTLISEDTMPSANGSQGRSFLLLGSDDPPRFVSWPGSLEMMITRSFRIRFYTGNEPYREYALNPMPRGAPPTATLDGKIVYFTIEDSRVVIGIDTATGAIVETLSIDRGGVAGLVVDTHIQLLDADGIIGVRDTSSGRWVGQLQYPGGLTPYYRSWWVHGDWVAAIGARESLGGLSIGPRPPSDLVLWKLAPLSGSSATPN